MSLVRTRQRARLRAFVRTTSFAALRATATALLVLAFLSVGTRIYLDRFWAPEPVGSGVSAPPTSLEWLQTVEHMEELEAALEVFRLRHRAYPDALVRLPEDGLVGRRALAFPSYDTPYYYRRAGATFELLPPRY